MSEWKYRRNSAYPYQTWREFPPNAIVLVKNAYGDRKIDLAKNLWWGYEREFDQVGEGVIIAAKRLDKPKRWWGSYYNANWNMGSVGANNIIQVDNV